MGWDEKGWDGMGWDGTVLMCVQKRFRPVVTMTLSFDARAVTEQQATQWLATLKSALQHEPLL